MTVTSVHMVPTVTPTGPEVLTSPSSVVPAYPEPRTWRGVICFILSDGRCFRRALSLFLVLCAFLLGFAMVCGPVVGGSAAGGLIALTTASAWRTHRTAPTNPAP